MTPADIASITHEANRAYCASIGDHSHVAWVDTPDWQRSSMINGVQYLIDNPSATPEDSHRSWLDEKERDGWRWGAVKDAERKLHPCFRPYAELPAEQQRKDALFHAIVKALK